MRNILNFNQAWDFYKGVSELNARENGEVVNLPHTWNATDGQDGGNDYFRGSCLYVKKVSKADLPKGDKVYLEINGANSSADVFVNGKKLAHHDGGYSTWRVDFTDEIQDETEIAIFVDNSPNERVYPQMADFTFYGGLYRNVNLIGVPATHFDLDYYGGKGLKITPVVDGKNANVEVEVFVADLQDGDELVYTIYDKDEKELMQVKSTEKIANFTIENARLWNGRKDPYLYCSRKVFFRPR